MSKVTTHLILLLLLIMEVSLYAQTQKVVLVEEGTGTWCQYCPRGEVYARELKKKYGNQAIFIAVHSGDPMENTEYNDRSGFPGLPNGNIDRTYFSDLEPYSDVDQDMQNQLSIEAPAEVMVDYSYDSNSRMLEVDINIEMLKSISGDFRLGAIVVEDGITGPAPQYDQSNAYSGGGIFMGGYEELPSNVSANYMVYNHVGRELLGGYDGAEQSLPNDLEKDQTYKHSFTYEVPSDFNAEYLYVVGVMLDNANGKVLNAGKSSYLNGEKNAKPFFHSSPVTVTTLGGNYEYEIVAHDPDYDQLEYKIVGSLPQGLQFENRSEGISAIVGSAEEEGVFTITIQLTDGNWTVEQTYDLVVSDSGYDWIDVGDEGFSDFKGDIIDIVVDQNGQLYTMAFDYDFNQIAVYSWNDSEWSKIGSNVSSSSSSSALEIDQNGVLHLLAGNSVYQLINNSWTSLGGYLESDIFADIAIGQDNQLYAVYFVPGGESKVVQWNGNSWDKVGTLPDNVIVWNSLETDVNGNIVLLYGTDGTSIAYSKVAVWDGNQWEEKGGYIEPSSQTFFDHNVAIDSEGIMYAALTIGVSEQMLNVYKYEQDEWVKIGENISGGATSNCVIEVDDESIPYVAFRDESSGGRTSVLKYIDGAWENVGNKGFSKVAKNHNMVIHENVPYVVYSDEGNQEKMSVKRYGSIISNIITTSLPSSEHLLYPNPCHQVLTIESELGWNYKVYNVSGQIMNEGEILRNTTQLDMSGYRSGVYLIKLFDGQDIQSYSVFKY